MVITCLQAARSLRADPVFVYGMFAGIVYACVAAGTVIGQAFGRSGLWSFTSLLVIALLATYFLAMLAAGGRLRRSPVVPEDPASVSETTANGQRSARLAKLEAVYGLSARELEVCELLSCGRDVPAIAQKLCISQNTVRTHTKNIYSKMDVHTKQDFLDTLEAM